MKGKRVSLFSIAAVIYPYFKQNEIYLRIDQHNFLNVYDAFVNVVLEVIVHHDTIFSFR